jgi:hypothetical protein
MKDFSAGLLHWTILTLFLNTQAEALAFCCICCFFRLPSCISGFAGARCLDWQGPFCVDWCCWRPAVCFRINKVIHLLVWSSFSLVSLLHSLGPYVSWRHIFAVGWLIGRATLRSKGQGCSKQTWKIGQNLCGLRVKCCDWTWEVGQHLTKASSLVVCGLV